MARIRTIKPEFWEDEKIGLLSHGARLLFLCCLNLSDDEGLLRWNAFYLASSAFMYDEIKTETIEKWMKELVDNELIYVYQAGKLKQKIGLIINFQKHQRIDKPQPSKFPKPDIANLDSDNDSPNDSENDSKNSSDNDSSQEREKEEEEEMEKEYSSSSDELLCEPLQPHREKINYNEIINFFNSETKGVFGTIRSPLSDKRKGMINARIKNHGKDAFADMIRKAYRSDFLKGQNKNGWRASFDWLIKPTNFEKVISGNYDKKDFANNPPNGNTEDFMRNIAEGIARANLEKQRRGDKH